MAIEVVTTNDLMVGSSQVIEGGSPNGNLVAVFDFENRKGYCRSAFPPVSPSQDWSKDGHDWNDLAIEALFR